jgi:hypothetical protein
MRACAVCGGEITNRNQAQKTCGHPRCSNEYRRQKPSRDRARRERAKAAELPRKAVTTKSMASVTERRDIADAMRRALDTGFDMTTAIKEVSLTMGHPPSVVKAVWRSVS